MLRRKSKAERKFDLARGVKKPVARLPLSPVSSNQNTPRDFSEVTPKKASKAKSVVKVLSPRLSPRRPRHTLPRPGSVEHDEHILEDGRYEARNYDFAGDVEKELVSTLEAMTEPEVNENVPPAASSPEATPLPTLKPSVTPKQLQTRPVATTTPATNPAFSVEDANRVISKVRE